MSILRREIELTVQLGEEPTEMRAMGIVSWLPDIEVLAMRSYCGPSGLVLLLITTDPCKASDVLQAAGFRCKSNPVILVGPLCRSGLAASVGTELANLGIDVLYSYVSRAKAGYQYLVLRTTEDDRAVPALEASAGIRDAAQWKSRQDRNVVSESESSLQETAA